MEHVLAPAHVGVALFCLIAFNVNPTRYAVPAQALVVAYLAHSLALALLLRVKHGLRVELLPAVHLLDIAWAAAISLVTGAPNSPFFGLFVFAILAAAYRWGLRATLTTAVLTIAVLFGQVLLVTLGGPAGGRLLGRPVEFDLVITRCSYVLIGALPLGYMAETEKELRTESTAAARLIAKVRAEAGMPGTQIVKALQFGAWGVVLKESATDLLFKSVRSVMAGQCWVGRDSVSDLVQGLRESVPASPEGAVRSAFGLTPREREILSSVVTWYTNREIAQQFLLSEDTVKHHLSNIFDKVGASNRVELTLFAVHHDLIDRG